MASKVSDGYHTFEELYEHRYVLFMALCSALLADDMPAVWKSKLHSDGTMFKDSFVMGIFRKKGEQITYHLPMRLWDQCNWENLHILKKAPKYDGHTPADVLERLRSII